MRYFEKLSQKEKEELKPYDTPPIIDEDLTEVEKKVVTKVRALKKDAAS